MRVKLVAHTPDPEYIVALAAKTCHSTLPTDELMERIDRECVGEFIEMLDDMGHESPLEHISFTFSVEGVSRSLLAQFTRHRIASYSVRSQRYVSERGFEYVIPPQIEENPEARSLYVDIMERQREAYIKIAEILYKSALKNEGDGVGADRAALRQRAREDARYVLPNACETQLIMTMNARSLLNFFRQRLCGRAQWEIRALAGEMLAEAQVVAPTVFRRAAPACAWGLCPEGNHSCGMAREMRERYRGSHG